MIKNCALLKHFQVFKFFLIRRVKKCICTAISSLSLFFVIKTKEVLFFLNTLFGEIFFLDFSLMSGMTFLTFQAVCFRWW